MHFQELKASVHKGAKMVGTVCAEKWAGSRDPRVQIALSLVRPRSTFVLEAIPATDI